MNDNRELQQQELHDLQRRVARMDARFRVILGGALIAAVVGVLTWAPIAMSNPDAPYDGVYDDLYRFTPNTPAIANEINSNFARLRSLTDVNAADIAALGSSVIDGSRIQNATLTADKLADGAVTPSKLASGAVNAQVRDYIRSSCYIHIGWRDACDGCNTTPATWASKRVGNTNNSCDGGAGERTCRDGWAGIGTGGDVDSNDQFYVKLRCD
jgi:hypothetical protein